MRFLSTKLMIKHIKSGLLFLTFLIHFQTDGQSNIIPEPPNPPRLVTDFTMTLSQNEVESLEQKLRAYADTTSSQIAVVVVKSLGDYEISQYAFELGQKWQIGQKGKNNGLLILWSTGNRKVFIATGYGMEEKIPDAIAKRIVNQVIIPYFKEGRYYQGLNIATDEVMARMSGQFESEAKGEKGFPIEALIFFIILMFIIMSIANRANRNRRNRHNDRDPFGGMGGGVFPPWTISNWGGSSHGGWGDSGGGGIDFGGFGGGDFGGGGAGGDY